MNAIISVADLVRTSGVAFGTSGARGQVAAMTDEVCGGYTEGFLRHLIDEGVWRRGDEVALAGDLRPSTPRILVACAAAVVRVGGIVRFCGYVPTPALALHALAKKIPAIMVTGSHIPDDRNGIKFYRPEGEILKEDEPGILSQRLDPGEWDSSNSPSLLPSLPKPVDIISAYRARYVNAFGSQALAGRRVGIYQHSAVGRDVLLEILSALGAVVVPLGRSEHFVPVDTEAVREEDRSLARQWAVEHGLDAIASTDGDSDRPLLSDEHGEWLRGDVLGVICARELGMRMVVTPVSSNSVAERCGAFAKVERTRIGSPHVIKKMNEAKAGGEQKICGFEANGGFLLADAVSLEAGQLPALPTRDAVLPIIAALVASAGGSLSQLVSALPKRFTDSDRLPDFLPARRDALMAALLQVEGQQARFTGAFGPFAEAPLTNIDLTDGVRMTFANDRVIHLRASGNAPELRCYSEAETPEVARGLISATLASIEANWPS